MVMPLSARWSVEFAAESNSFQPVIAALPIKKTSLAGLFVGEGIDVKPVANGHACGYLLSGCLR